MKKGSFAATPKLSVSSAQIRKPVVMKNRVQKPEYRPKTVKRGNFSEAENKTILREKQKGTTWEGIARLLGDRMKDQVKKHYHNILKHRLPESNPAVSNIRNSAKNNKVEANQVSTVALPPGTTSSQQAIPQATHLVPVTPEDLETKLYNKVVYLPNKLDAKQRPHLYFVLEFNELESKCHLVPLMEDGPDKMKPEKMKWKLIPEGEAEELTDVPASNCTIIKSTARNKVQDADKEAWIIEDPRY